MPPRRTRKPPAAKRRGGASRKGSGSPGWLWLLSGTALGAVIAVALYFADQPRPEHHAQHTPQVAAKDKPGRPADAERHLGDIFEQLDHSTPKAVTAAPPPPPVEPPTAAAATPKLAPPSPASIPHPTTRPTNKPAPVASKPARSRNAGPTWWLQASAFRSPGQADSLKARLTLTGLPVKVISGRGGNNILWYRVRVGPYRNKRAVSRARQRLKQQKISPVLIKQ